MTLLHNDLFTAEVSFTNLQFQKKSRWDWKMREENSLGNREEIEEEET